MAEHGERIAILEANHANSEKKISDVVESLEGLNASVEDIAKTVNGILLNLEGKTGFFRGVLFMAGVMASAVGALVAWVANRYYGH